MKSWKFELFILTKTFSWSQFKLEKKYSLDPQSIRFRRKKSSGFFFRIHTKEMTENFQFT